MIEVELEIAGITPEERPFASYKHTQFRILPRIREYIVLGNNYFEVAKIFYWEGIALLNCSCASLATYKKKRPAYQAGLKFLYCRLTPGNPTALSQSFRWYKSFVVSDFFSYCNSKHRLFYKSSQYLDISIPIDRCNT